MATSNRLFRHFFRVFLISTLLSATVVFAGSSTEPDLEISISAAQNPVLVKSDIEYSIVVKNNGTVGAIDSTVTTTIPSTINYSFGGSGWLCDRTGDTVSCTYDGVLGAGATANTLSLSRETVSTGSVTQNVTVSATNGDYDTSNNDASVTVDVGQTNLQISKTASKPEVEAEEDFTYTITVTNPAISGSTIISATDIVVTDTIPSNFTITSNPGCSKSGQDLTCTIASLNVGESQNFVIGVKAPSSIPATNPVTNTATLNRTGYVGGTNVKDLPTSDSADVTVTAADVTVSLSASPSPAPISDTLTYTVTASNLNGVDANDVEVEITLDGDLQNPTASGSGWNCPDPITSNTFTCTLQNPLQNGSPRSFTITAGTPATHQTVTTRVHIGTSSAETDTGNNDATLAISVEGADLRIEKEGPDSAPVETNIQYTITVYNDGIAPAQNVVVRDTLDDGMVYLNDSLTNHCQDTGNNVYECTIGTIDAGSSVAFTLDVTTPNKTGTTTNDVSVDTDTDENNQNDKTASKTTALVTPDLNIAKSNTPTEVGLGGNFTYTITVTNSKNAVAQNAKITDTLPSGITVTGIDSNPDHWDCGSGTFPMTGDGSASFNCTLASFPANGTSTITFDATAPNSTGTYQNRARIGHSLDNNDGEDTADITVTGVELEVTKIASATAVAGGTIDYEITIKNTSLTDAKTLTLTDDMGARLGSGYTISSISQSDGWNCSGSIGTDTLSCSLGTLASEGATTTIKFSVAVPVNAPLGTVHNYATVHVDSPDAYDKTSTTASTEIEGADIVVTKSGDRVGIANERVNVNVVVTNNGSAIAKDVNVTIDLNANNIANFTDIETDCGTGSFTSVTEPFTCQLGDLAKNGSATVAIRATAPNYDSNFPGHKKIKNTATAVTSTTQSTTSNDEKNWWIEIKGADLIVDKVPNVNEVAVGKTVTYTISLKNQGDAVATNITLSDSVVENTDGLSLSNLSYNFVDWSCTTNFPAGFDCTYKHDLASGQSTSNVTVDATAPNTTSVLDQQRSNRVDVSNDTAESDTATTNSKVAPVTIRGAELTISKSVSPGTVGLGERVTFTIDVGNSGLADAEDTNVTDTLPDGFTTISTSGCDNDGFAVSGRTVTCQLGTIANTNGSKTFTITANAPNTNGDYTNTATVSTSTPEADTTNNSDDALLHVEGADLVIYKAAPLRVAGNSEYQYTISLRNQGRSSAFGAEINDTVPANVTYVTGSLSTLSSAWTCSISGSDIHCQTNDPNFEIPNGYDENIVTFRVKAGPAHDWVYNTVTTETDTSESNLANNTYTARTEVIDIDLAVRKLINGVNYGAAENYAAIGETITYTLQVRNVSQVDLDITDVNVTDLIPSNVTNVSVTPAANFTCNNPTTAGSTLLCTMNGGVVLSRGQTRNVATITVTVIDAASFDVNDENNNFVVNRYKAETSLTDQHLANNAPTGGDGYLHTNTLVRGANVSVDKRGPREAGAEQRFTYTLDVRNYPRPDTYTGTPPAHDVPSSGAAGITVTDILPTGVTFVSASGANWNCNESGGTVTCAYGGNLPPSNTPSSIDITVAAPNDTGITLTNEANVTTSTPELERLLLDNGDTLGTRIVGTDIVVTKTGPATAGMGDELAYTIRVENNSSVPAAGIHVDDILHTDVNLSATWNRALGGSGWTCVDNSATSDHNVSCDYSSTLPANGSASFTIYAIAPGYTGTIRNRAVATTTTAETNRPNISDFDTEIEGAEVGFANNPFQQSPNPVGALKPIDYTITVINRGHSEARDINLTMQFPSGYSEEFNVTSTGGDSGWNCHFDSASSLLTCRLATLAPNNATSRVEIHATAPNANEVVSYTVHVEGTDGSGQITQETISPNPTTTVKGADLKIEKYVQDLENPGYDESNVTAGLNKYVEFNITVENRELGLAHFINLMDDFNTGFSNLTISSQSGWNGTCAINGHNLQCIRNELLQGETLSVVVKAKTPGVEGIINNDARVVNTTVETDNTNNTDSAYVKVEGSRFNVDVNVSKTTLAFDELFDYVVTIVNTGKNEAEDINISDTLPTGFIYVGNNGSDAGWNCTPGDGNHTVVCELPSLAGYSGSTRLVLNVEAPKKIGRYTDEITVDSPSIPAPVEASAEEVEVRGADLEISLTADDTEVLEEHNTTVTMVVKNIDISTARDVNVTHTFTSSPAGTFAAVDDNASCTLTASTVRCHWERLSPDENRTVVITLTTPNITSDTTLSIHSSAVTATEEPDTSNNSADASTDVKVIKAIAEWRMDECSWGTVVDQTGNHNGTAKNGAHTVNKILTKDSNGRVSFYRAGEFDGSNDYISIPNSSEINTAVHNKRTVALWFNADTVTGTHVLYEEGGGARGLAIYIKDGELYVGGWNRPESGWTGTYLHTAISEGEWHHVTLVLDAIAGSYTHQNDAFRAYLDGVRFDSGIGTQLWGHGNAIGIGAVNGGTRLHDGTTGGGRYFNGFIDEAKLFNIALDDTAIATLYKREKAYINYDGTTRAKETVCGVDAEVTLSAPPTAAVESDFQYTITVNNLTLEPIEELNLSVQLPNNVIFVEDNVSTTWKSCMFDSSSYVYSCHFSDDDNLSNAWFYDSQEIIQLTVTAPNEITTLEANTSIVTTPVDYDTSNNSESVTTQTVGTNLRITKSVDLTTPALNAPFVYTITVTNDSTVDARDINLTDHVPAVLSIASNDHSNWGDDFQIDSNSSAVTASLPLLKAGGSRYFTLTVASPQNGTVTNSVDVQTRTAEEDYGDNHAEVSVNVGSSEGNTTVKLKDGFSERKTMTRYGDLVAIGNTYLTGDDSNASALLSDIDVSAHSPSTAKLDLPYDTNITVTYARLYWTGHIHGEPGDATSVETDDDYKTITFTAPDGDHDLTADDTYYYYNKTQYDTYRRIYACSADVTNILETIGENLGTYDGNYGVKNLKANTGVDKPIFMTVTDGNTTSIQAISIGHFGGWSLVVFYEVNHRAHRDQVYKNINLFDGFRKLVPAAVGYDRLTIPIDGFLTPYAGETIDSRLLLFAGGGERARAVDHLSIVKIDNNTTSDVNISDTLNPVENVLNGTITQAGHYLTPRNPQLNYSMGIDMDQFDISSDFNTNEIYLGHLQGETNITLSVGRERVGNQELFDQSFPSVIGLSTEIFNPDFIDSYKECFVENPITGDYVRCEETNVTRGGEVIYRITIINTGNTDATKVILQDPLPAEVTYIPDEAELKVVSITERLCDGSGGSPVLDGSNAKNAECKQWLIDKGYFNTSTGLTASGRAYIASLDSNGSDNHLNHWDQNFPASAVSAQTMTNQQMLDLNYTTTTYANNDDVNRTLLTVNLHERLNYNDSDINGTFPALNVSWVEFKVKVNSFAQLNKAFVNKAIINFTNPTLEYFSKPDADQRQESTSAESPPVVFQWTALSSDIRDPGRVSVGTKIVGKAFDLNISIDDSNTTFATFAQNYPDVNLTVWRIKLVDGNNSYAEIADFNRSDFTILSSEYLPIGTGMSWIIDKNISLPTAWRDIYFSIQYKIRYQDNEGVKEQVAPSYYGPFGDHFAMRPEKFTFSVSNSIATAGSYLIIKSGQPFDIDANATDASGAIRTIGYTQRLFAANITDSNITMATIAITDEKGCVPDITSKIHLEDFNFTDGAAQTVPNVKFDDVGYVTLKLRDTNWSDVDRTNGDCNATVDNDDQDQNDSYVSCYIKGEAKLLFIPASIEVNTSVTNQGGGFTYMADDMNRMHSTVETVIRSLNLDGNVTEAFTSGCYADDVNMTLEANVSSAESAGIDLLWKLDTDSAVSLLANVGTGPESVLHIIDDTNFTNGIANVTFLIDVNRSITHAHYPVDIQIDTGKAKIDNYLATGTEVPETVTDYPLDDGHRARFWYARMHAPDYRSSTTTIETPIFIEVFCNNDIAACGDYGISGLPESSDDVNWWINTNDTRNVVIDLNATQEGANDPLVTINGGTNAVADLNATFTNGTYSAQVTYGGSSNLYKTKIILRPHPDWLKYNKFFPDGRMNYHVEFNLPTDDWSGIGEKGETVETNGSRKSNRRLEW
ncbi:LamG-like jellyroll fold domain-containing protein [Hydrogenimonas cancrithermarum]|uniref:DUF11 domain-containing protein n=1 Tax=Hydrogenimonas cancrithermarum TaxID=2993563 RepID=A0ABM8FMB3_9BACT|nr:LamG-like jellyroll fold domain-containing protein [Hydrogenimonas cancrithermarum]BDY13504.1 hypothetical protein HCR_18160 [Hydrogenimonas cancrithermarum]